MNETLCEKKNITIFTVSDFDLCFESLIFDRNRMVNSVTYYFPGNSTFEPLSVQWNEFMNPSRYLNVRMSIQYFKYKEKYCIKQGIPYLPFLIKRLTLTFFLPFSFCLHIIHIHISVHGKCLTAKNISLLQDQQFLKLNLNQNLTFLLFLHDQNFFFVSHNPQSPSHALKINMSEIIQEDEQPWVFTQWINVVKKIKYNRNQSPCVDDPNYSFSFCLVEYIVKSTNCTVRFRL